MKETGHGTSDAHLMERFRAGDEDAFTLLFRRYSRRLFGYVVGITKDPDMADDVTQKVFIKLARKPEAWRPTASFSSWLHRVARNAALDALKSGPQRAGLDEIDRAMSAEPVGRETPGTGESGGRMRALVFRTIQRLEGPQREALVLREYSELSYREICEITGRSLANVKQDIHQARQFLRSELAPHLERTVTR